MKDMYLIKSRRNAVAVASIATIAVIALSLYSYSYMNYGRLTLWQIHPKLVLSLTSFNELSRETVDHNAKLAEAIKEVTIKYDRATQDCPAQRLVFCDIPSATRYTTSVTLDEYTSLANAISFANLDDSNNNDSNTSAANVKYRCMHENLADNTHEEYCYYIIELEQTVMSKWLKINQST